MLGNDDIVAWGAALRISPISTGEILSVIKQAETGSKKLSSAQSGYVRDIDSSIPDTDLLVLYLYTRGLGGSVIARLRWCNGAYPAMRSTWLACDGGKVNDPSSNVIKVSRSGQRRPRSRRST